MVASVKRRLNRRRWLVGTSLGMLAACSSQKGTGFNGYGLVANFGDSSLAAIDLTSFRLTSTTALGSPPSQVLPVPSPSASHLAYVLTPANGAIHLIDGQLRRAKLTKVSDEIAQIGLSDDGLHMLALAPRSRELIELDLESARPLARHKLSIKADSIDISKTGYVAVAHAAGAVELIHLASGKRSRTDTPSLGSVRFRVDGKLLLAANLQNRSLLALDVPTLAVVAELPLAMQPENLCFNQNGGQLFVSGTGMDGVAVVFPYHTIEVDQTLLAGRDPGTMTCSESPEFLFVGSSSGSDVCILNIATRKVIGFVEMGGHPTFMTVTPDSQYALVLNRASGDMGVIHIPAIRANRLKNGVALYTMLSVGSKPVDLAVVPRVV